MLIEPDEFDHAQDGWSGVPDGELPCSRVRSLGGADHHADAGAVDEGKLGEVENGVDVPCQSFCELGCS